MSITLQIRDHKVQCAQILQPHLGESDAGGWTTSICRKTLYGYLLPSVLRRTISRCIACRSQGFLLSLCRNFLYTSSPRTACGACAHPSFCSDLLRPTSIGTWRAICRWKCSRAEPYGRSSRSDPTCTLRKRCKRCGCLCQGIISLTPKALLSKSFLQSNLLTPRTVQAHCTFLSQPSLESLAKTGTAIAHCPLSNAYFSAEPFRLREALDAHVRVGLGTDIAGGYSIDIMNAMRQAVVVSRMREGTRLSRHVGAESDDTSRVLSIDWKESLYLATKGGTEALNLPEGTGSFVVGAPFDAQCSKSFSHSTDCC